VLGARLTVHEKEVERKMKRQRVVVHRHNSLRNKSLDLFDKIFGRFNGLLRILW
jgi:hypothetical protein